ncbi:hypothetical protein K438DRAFT_1844107 [Mycena galopus ATCC 62051]|nr:hypothetical protein K438DRAFT_1844107 [Mycena galopus ATCC 62051]
MLSLQARYKDDRFEVLPKATAVEWEWRLKCLDCPGKVRMSLLSDYPADVSVALYNW